VPKNVRLNLSVSLTYGDTDNSETSPSFTFDLNFCYLSLVYDNPGLIVKSFLTYCTLIGSII
jgi:hypothetical protein